MTYRHAVAVLALAAVVGDAASRASGARQLARTHASATAPGRGRRRGAIPTLQGVWRYEAAIPLERPAQFEGRES